MTFPFDTYGTQGERWQQTRDRAIAFHERDLPQTRLGCHAPARPNLTPEEVTAMRRDMIAKGILPKTATP